MKIRFNFITILTLAAIFVLTTLSLSSQNKPYNTVTRNGQSFYEYKVQPGEGLYSVARNMSVSQETIIKHNPDVTKGLQVGQSIFIPTSEVTTTSTNVSGKPQNGNQNHTFKHTVARGETLYSISQMYNTTVAEIMRYNSGLTEIIEVGQVIIIPQTSASSSNDVNYRYHVIAPKETLYSVSKTYSLKPEDLVAANQGLSVETFRAGTTIRIPITSGSHNYVSYQEQTKNIVHKVKRSETLYSISRKYNVDIEEIKRSNPMLDAGLRIGMELHIPVKAENLDQNASVKEIEANNLLIKRGIAKNVNVIKIGLLLPFLEEDDNQHLRLQEYYEGFLIAVDRMKNMGANIELFVFDIGAKNDTRKLESLLGTSEMKDLHLIIGGISEDQISVLARFTQKNNIKYVIPLSSRNELVQNNSSIFQVNAPQSYLYSKAADAFMNIFKNENVIIANLEKTEKADFISVLKSDLRKSGNIAKDVTFGANANAETLMGSLRSNRENVIVPTSGNSADIRRLLDAIQSIKESNPEYSIRLFGYPEWQTFGSAVTNRFKKTGTYFYSAFYADEADTEMQKFLSDFKKWYNRDLINTYPKYGMLGYDTGLFFMTALHRYGTNFEQNIQSVDVKTIQFAFHFERVNNWGGFINRGLYLIHYDTNGVVHKINKSRL